MTITTGTSLTSTALFSGLTSVADMVSLPSGGAVLLGVGMSGGLALQIHSSAGFLVKNVDLPFGSTAKDLTLLEDNSLLVTCTVGGSNVVARYDLTGTLLSEPTAIDSTVSNIVALDNGGFAAFDGLFMRIHSFFGSTIVFEESLTLNFATGKVAATRLDNGNIAVAFAQLNGAETELVTAILTQDGTIVQAPTVRDTVGTLNTEPAIVATSDGFAVAYITNRFGNADVALAYFGADGTPSGTPRQISNSAGTAEQSPTLTRVGDNILLAWMDNTFSDSDAVVRLLPDDLASFAVLASSSAESGASDIDNLVTASLGTNSALTVMTNITTNLVRVTRQDVVLQAVGDAADDSYAATAQAEQIFLGNGIDTLSYAASTEGVLVFLDGRAGRGGLAQNDVLSSVENVVGSGFADRIVGNGAANGLTGGAGNDTLEGGIGADTITGGAGRDVLKGGADADVFVFLATADSGIGAQNDRIRDFGGTDVIDLSAIDANARQAGNQAFTFGTVTPGANRVWFAITADGDTVIRGDVDGNRRPDFEILLSGSHVLTAADFIL